VWITIRTVSTDASSISVQLQVAVVSVWECFSAGPVQDTDVERGLVG